MSYENMLDLYISHSDTLVDLEGKSEWIIGVAESCDLDLSVHFADCRYQTISRRHLRVVRTVDGSALLYDLESTNGTRLNGRRVIPHRAYPLEENDVIQLASNLNFTLEMVARPRPVTEPIYSSRPVVRSVLDKAIPPMRSLYLDSDDHFVVNGIRLPYDYLTPVERNLLSYLYECSGRLVPYDEVVIHVWGRDQAEYIQNNTVSKVVSNLRRKLDEVSPGAGDRYLKTIYGRGLACHPL